MVRKSSKKSARHSRILDVLEINPSIRVNALADELDVSTETVRRDLAELDETGRIKRTYGGAVRTTAFEPALAERLKLHVQERERVARHAVASLADVQSLFIGGGATTLHFARALRSIDHPLTVLTPALNIAIELASNPLIEVMSLPGVVEPKERLVNGAETLKAISQFRTQVAVVGASALDQAGVSEALLSAAQVYAAMIASADRTLVLADQSKFGKRSLQLITGWGPDTTLLADTEPLSPLKDHIEGQGGKVVIAEDL
ncbi:MAG: DeoR/GlpR family DNA-binding transcription regulator [Pseudomonadota bacterium]